MYVSVHVPVCVYTDPHTFNMREEPVFLHFVWGDSHIPPCFVPCAV